MLVKSAVRVLDLLELVAASATPLSLSELSRRLGIPKSSNAALLETLVTRGYLSRDVSGGYRIDHSLSRGWVGGLNGRLLTVARPVMRKLAETTGETVFLGVLTEEGKVQYLDKVVSAKAVRYDAEITELRPAYATSIGKVLLACLDDSTRAPAIRSQSLRHLTPRTITTPAALEAELDRIRRAGLAVNVDERVVGAAGVAAPIYAGARVVAALNLSAPTPRFTSMRSKMTRAVLSGAAEISRLLAPTDPTGPRPITRTRRTS
jgi:DNA-binding IclR family transcriptional regulator